MNAEDTQAKLELNLNAQGEENVDTERRMSIKTSPMKEEHLRRGDESKDIRNADAQGDKHSLETSIN